MSPHVSEHDKHEARGQNLLRGMNNIQRSGVAKMVLIIIVVFGGTMQHMQTYYTTFIVKYKVKTMEHTETQMN